MDVRYVEFMKKVAADFMHLIVTSPAVASSLSGDLLRVVCPWLTTEEVVRLYRILNADEMKMPKEVEDILAKSLSFHFDRFEIHPKKK